MAVPKLRFKKFDNDWNEVKTGDIFDNVADKGYTDKTVLTIVQGKGTVPRAESGRNMIFDEASISGYKRVMQDDFIIHLRSFEGGLEQANEEGVISPAYTVLRPKNKVATQFLYDYFHTNKFINGVLAKAVEGIRDGRQISYNMFKWLKIPFPSYEEQQKIADFLTTFDKRITAQQNIVADMEEIKKGLLQKIFSQEIRFKDENGEDYPEWEKTKLEDVCEYSSEKITYTKSTYIGTENILKDFSGVLLSKDLEEIDGIKYEVGDILLSNIRPYLKKVWLANINGNCSSDVLVLHVNNNNIIPKFLYCVIANESFISYVMESAKGTKMPRGDKKQIMKYIFGLPSKDEQNKIASFLSAYDKKIEAEKKILADLQDLKKGLLQQMFV